MEVCSNISRCINFELISFDNIFICKKCNVIFQKPDKLLNKEIFIKCCNKQSIINKYNKPVCNYCKKVCIINI